MRSSRSQMLFEIFGLCGLAITQPLLSVFGRVPDQFAVRGATSADIVLFAMLVALFPTVVFLTIEMAAGILSDRAREWVHRGVIVLLVGVLVRQVIGDAMGALPALVLATLAGVGVVVARERWGGVRLWLRYLALAPFGFVALFLLATPTGELLRVDTSYSDAAVGKPAPVVLVVLDELPLATLLDANNEIDEELYPNLAAFADESHWFRNTTSVSPLTWNAVPAILTGRAPESGVGPTAADHPENLFTLLGGSYDLNVRESITRLCPSDECRTFGPEDAVQGLMADVRAVARSRLGVDNKRGTILIDLGDPTAGFEEFSAGLGQSDRQLSYLHLLLPHAPFTRVPDGERYDGFAPPLPTSEPPQQWTSEPWFPSLYRQRHILQMMYTDRLLGEVLDALRERGTYDESLVAVVADHGASFEPEGYFRSNSGEPLTDAAAADLLWVPFFLKEPAQTEGEVHDDNVLTIDVLPTIADVLEVDVPWEVDGRSALGPPRATDEKPWWGTEPVGWGIEVQDPVFVDGRTGWADVQERSLATFLPPAGDPERLWRVGPHPDLVGRSTSQAADRLVPVDLELVEPERYEVDDDDLPVVLVQATGTDVQVGDPIAVAVGGRIAATGPVFEHEGQRLVAVVVDADRIRRGDVIELYAIVG